MGYLEGFARHVPADRASGSASPRRTSRTRARSAAKPERLHGRHVLNRYEDGMEKCIGCELCAGVCPARCIYVRGADNPPDDPVSPGRALRLRLRDQLPAVHPLRPVRRGLPHRGHHRDEAVRVLLHQPPGRHLHQGRAGRRRRRPPQQLPWEDWRDPARTQHTSAWMRATAPVGRRRLRGHGRLVGRARLRRARARAGPGRRRRRRRAADEPRRPTTARRRTTHDDGTGRPLTVEARRLRRLRGASCSSARSASCCSRNPVHSALSLVATLFGVAVLFVAQDAQLPGRRAGDRLRRRHRRAVPVRDHAARRRPRPRTSTIEPLGGPAAGGRRRRARRSLGARVARRRRSPAATTHGRHRRAARAPRPLDRRRRPTSTSSAESLFTDYLFAFEITSVLLDRSPWSAPSCWPAGRRPTPIAEPEADGRATSDAASSRPSRGGRRDARPRHVDADLVPRARRGAVRHRRRRAARPPQPAGDVHVRRADAQRRQPHVRHLRPRCSTTSAARSSCSSCSWSPPPRSWSASGIIVAILRRRPGATADDISVLKG